MPKRIYLFILIFANICSCANHNDTYEWKSIKVVATAFNSVYSQTDGTPNVAAWGDTLVPGMYCIAVSRDLIALGLDHNTKVRIEGKDNVYLVKDKMNARYTKKIDIFMGKDVKKAKEWGRKALTIQYRIKKTDAAEK